MSKRVPEPPCEYCLDSGMAKHESGVLYPCGCRTGWAERDRRVNYCGKEIGGAKCSAVYSRPTVLHYVSRLYLMCFPCFNRFTRRGLPDSHFTMAPEGLRCGSLVVILKNGKSPEFISESAPDYMPVECPRKFGMHMDGGDLVRRWKSRTA